MIEFIVNVLLCIGAFLAGMFAYEIGKAKWVRRGHNDRDYLCKYWWGDRGGYDHRLERCSICNPSTKDQR